jgi:hypothetical protein
VPFVSPLCYLIGSIVRIIQRDPVTGGAASGVDRVVGDFDGLPARVKRVATEAASVKRSPFDAGVAAD